jgi:hypothetical protein
MHVRRGIVLLLGLAAGPLEAQASSGWGLTVGVEGLRFAGAARDTVAAEPAAAGLGPSGRVGLRAAVQRRAGSWGVALAFGWAGGDVEASNDAVAIRDRTADLSRYRLGAAVERILARPGEGELSLEAGPALDLWALDGDTRLRLAAVAGIVLRLPLGRAAVEHRLALGLEASPLTIADVGGDFELRTLRTVELGVGVRLPL